MSQANVRPAVTPLGVVTVAWLITSVYYFYQYAMRSAPAVMVPQMSDAFGLTPVGIASLVGLFYYAYAPFSLVAGVAMDQGWPKHNAPQVLDDHAGITGLPHLEQRCQRSLDRRPVVDEPLPVRATGGIDKGSEPF